MNLEIAECAVANISNMDNITKDVSEINDVCQAESIKKDDRILQQEEEILEAKVKISEWQNEIFRKVYLDVKSALGEAKSFAEFQALLSKNGISVSIKRSSKTNNAQGVIFTRGDYSVKGSKLDRSLGLGRIAKHFQEIRQAEQREAQRLHVPIPEQEPRSESKVRYLAAGLFEGNLGKSQEQDMKDPPKKRKGLRR